MPLVGAEHIFGRLPELLNDLCRVAMGHGKDRHIDLQRIDRGDRGERPFSWPETTTSRECPLRSGQRRWPESADGARVLSGGERRLLEISRALIMDPEVILIDEPSIGLEPRAIETGFAC